MIRRGFASLSAGEQTCYADIVHKIESGQTHWQFAHLSFDFVAKVFRVVLDDHPEYFWFNGAVQGTTTTLGAQVTVVLEPQFSVPPARVPAMRRQFNAVVEELIRRAQRQASFLYGQILLLHDYIVRQTDYQLNAPHCYDAYGCLVLHRAVCAGYAAAFQVLMQRLGVECGRVTGWSSSEKTGEVSHAWNYIRLSDGYYYVDVTWDDPIMNGGERGENLSYDYFCLDLQDVKLTHKFAADQFIPKTCGSKFNYYRYRGWYLERYSFPAVRDLAVKQLQRADKFSVKFGSVHAAQQAKRDLIDSQKVFSIPGCKRGITYGIDKSGLILTVNRT